MIHLSKQEVSLGKANDLQYGNAIDSGSKIRSQSLNLSQKKTGEFLNNQDLPVSLFADFIEQGADIDFFLTRVSQMPAAS